MADKKEAILVGDVYTNIINPTSGKSENFKIVSTWYDGTPMNNSKVDGYLYRRKGAQYLRRVIDKDGELFLEKDTMTQMRALTSVERLLLKAGVYKGITLNGYYAEGDTPAPIQYFLSTTSAVDDGGSVIVIDDIKLEHNFSNNIDLSYFGLKDGDYLSQVYNTAIEILTTGGSLHIPKGSFKIDENLLIKSGINVSGKGIDETKLYSENPRQHIFKTNDYTFKPDTTTTGLISSGSRDIPLSNTSDIEVGDFIVLKSDRRFTRGWDNGTAIRPYYTDGEMLRVTEVYPTSVVVESNIFLEFLVGSQVKIFKPTGHYGSIKNMTISNVKNTSTGSNAIYLTGYLGLTIDNVKTQNTNLHGVGLFSCYQTNIGYIECEGGTENLGLNYGVMSADGTKYTTINNIKAKQCRHGVAGGGTGFACSMYLTCNNAYITESQNYSIDAHANTAFFTFKNAYVDNFYSLSGIGHSMEHIISSKLTYTGIAIEGGINCKLGYGYVESAGDFFTNYPWIGFSIGTLELNYASITSSGFRLFGMPSFSKNNKIGNLIIRNRYFNPSDTVENNFNKVSGNTRYAVTLREGTQVDSVTIEGWMRGIICSGKDITIGKYVAKNTGWSPTTGFDSAIFAVEGGSHNLSLKSAVIDNTELDSSYLTRTNIIQCSGGTAVQTRATYINNVNYQGGNVLNKVFRSSFFQDFILQGNKLGSNSGAVPSLTGKFYGNDFITDTVTLPQATIANIGGVKQGVYIPILNVSDLIDLSSPDATDLETAITLLNEIKSKYNGTSGIRGQINSAKSKINQILVADRDSGQNASS